jgi:hypothetical protein
MHEPVVGSFVQFIADNADHNAATLDGHGTFHGMGMMAGFSPSFKVDRAVPRKSVNKKELQAAAKVPIKPWTQEKKQPPLLYGQHDTTPLNTTWCACDLLWKISWPLRQDRPSWSGWMQGIVKGSHPGKSMFQFLPMIDLDPSNITCIHSTLHFICDQAAVHGQRPIVTFNQPLWWKATMIVESEPAD